MESRSTLHHTWRSRTHPFKTQWKEKPRWQERGGRAECTDNGRQRRCRALWVIFVGHVNFAPHVMTLGKVRNAHGTYLLSSLVWNSITWLRSKEKIGFEKNIIAQLNVFFQGRRNVMAADIQRVAYLPNQHLKACASYSGKRQIWIENSESLWCHAELIFIKCVIIYNLTLYPVALNIIWLPLGNVLDRLKNNLWHQ